MIHPQSPPSREIMEWIPGSGAWDDDGGDRALWVGHSLHSTAGCVPARQNAGVCSIVPCSACTLRPSAGTCARQAGSPEGRARAVPSEQVVFGWRNARAARNSPDGVPIRQAAASHAHGAGLSTCPSSGPSARVAPAAAWTGRGRCFGRGFRHGPCCAVQHVRHRPGPVSRPRPLEAGLERTRPGGWLARLAEASAPPAEPRWPSPPRSTRPTLGRVAPGHSLPLASKRSRSIRQRE